MEEDELAKKVVDELMKRVYLEFGKSISKKVFWLFLAVLIAAGVSTGILHIPGIK